MPNACSIPVRCVSTAPVLVRRPSTAVAAGFPSPAEDYYDGPVDLTAALIPNPAATFLVRVSGWSMRDAGIFDGDELIVDRSLPAVDGRVVVALIDGEFTVKRLRMRGRSVILEAANSDYPPIVVRDPGFRVWGVVRTVIHHV